VRIRYIWQGFEAFLVRREIRRGIRIAFREKKRVGSAMGRSHEQEVAE
jgi:hypothetical protein